MEEKEPGDELPSTSHEASEKLQRLIKKVDAVLDTRIDNIMLVLERPFITENYLGCLRTAECMGIQRVWIVVQQRGCKKKTQPPQLAPAPAPLHDPEAAAEGRDKAEIKEFRARVRLSRSSSQWLDVREFRSTSECIQELKKEGWEIWSTELSAESISLDSPSLQLTPGRGHKVAIVMGREADGVTEEMLVASHKRVYLPLCGFNESLNLQVATGMVLQRLIGLVATSRGGERVGDLSAERRGELRTRWLQTLSEGRAGREDLLKHAGVDLG